MASERAANGDEFDQGAGTLSLKAQVEEIASVAIRLGRRTEVNAAVVAVIRMVTSLHSNAVVVEQQAYTILRQPKRSLLKTSVH